MYHAIIPVTSDHDPVVIEGKLQTQILIFNAGPATIRAHVWNEWNGNIDDSYESNQKKSNLNLELRPGNQKIVSGAFIRLSVDVNHDVLNYEFAAVGARIINELYYEFK